jgi:hypothetical protein
MTITALKAVKSRYAGDAERPLGSFLGLMSVYAGLVTGAGSFIRWRRIELPDRVSAADIALLGVASHKVARLLAKDPVTSPLRAPFTRFAGQSGEAEVAEEVVGRGAQKAVGELVTCPFCLDQWVATGFVFGLLVAPRATRLAAMLLTTVTLADVLQFGYDALQPDD